MSTYASFYFQPWDVQSSMIVNHTTDYEGYGESPVRSTTYHTESGTRPHLDPWTWLCSHTCCIFFSRTDKFLQTVTNLVACDPYRRWPSCAPFDLRATPFYMTKYLFFTTGHVLVFFLDVISIYLILLLVHWRKLLMAVDDRPVRTAFVRIIQFSTGASV